MAVTMDGEEGSFRGEVEVEVEVEVEGGEDGEVDGEGAKVDEGEEQRGSLARTLPPDATTALDCRTLSTLDSTRLDST